MGFKDTKVLIFDLWGTLLENGIFPSPVKQTKKIMGLFKMPFPEYIHDFEKAFMTKDFENLKKAFNNVFSEMKVDPKDYNREERLIGLWNKNKLFVKPYPDTIEVLEKLSSKYKLVLLTNSPFYTREIIEKFSMEKYFEKMYFSYETGMLKSDIKSYEMIFKDLKVKATDCVMIGDSMESDIQSANNANVKGILVDRRNKREYEHKVFSLSEIDSKLEE